LSVDLKQLGTDLQSGNLSGAQSDYQCLPALGEEGPFANSEPFSKASRAATFNPSKPDSDQFE
jgi:hypothetical protein